MVLLTYMLALLPMQGPSPVRKPTPRPAVVRTIPMPEASSASFQNLCISIGTRINAKDFAGAAKLAQLLPKPNPKVSWSVVGATEDQTFDLEDGRDLALQATQAMLRTQKLALGQGGDIRVRIAGDVPSEQTEAMGTSPRVDFALALTRGGKRIGKNEAYSGVSRALGLYFGLSDTPAVGSAMHPVQGILTSASGFNSVDLSQINSNLRVASALREAIQARTPVSVKSATFAAKLDTVNLGDVEENTTIAFPVPVSNQGAGPLRFFMRPDCTCFQSLPGGQVLPGQTLTDRVVISTRDLNGPISRRLLVVSNDPQKPYQELPVTFKVRPRVRFFRPEGANLTVPDGGIAVDLFLIPAPGSGWEPSSFEVLGVPAKVTQEKWSGTLADPFMQESAQNRTGWRYRVQLEGNLPPGRTAVAIEVSSRDRLKPMVRSTLYVQSGIVALPDSMYLGDLSVAMSASGLLSRPGQSFKVKEVKVNHSNLKGSFKKLPDGDWLITVAYDGKGQRGDLAATLEVLTDDPKQPKIEIPVAAYVR